MKKSKDRILFNSFLKENNCTKQFVSNFNESFDHCGKSIIECFKDGNSPAEIIMQSFTWELQKEGGSYWRKPDIKWRKYLKTATN